MSPMQETKFFRKQTISFLKSVIDSLIPGIMNTYGSMWKISQIIDLLLHYKFSRLTKAKAIFFSKNQWRNLNVPPAKRLSSLHKKFATQIVHEFFLDNSHLDFLFLTYNFEVHIPLPCIQKSNFSISLLAYQKFWRRETTTFLIFLRQFYNSLKRDVDFVGDMEVT